jgi:hypothetical protein
MLINHFVYVDDVIPVILSECHNDCTEDVTHNGITASMTIGVAMEDFNEEVRLDVRKS